MNADATCPSRHDLESFVRGEKTPADIERVAEHLESCSICAETIDQMLTRETLGELVVAARANGMLPDLPAGPSMSTLMERLCSLQPKASPDITLAQSADATPAPDEGEDGRFEFFSPPQAADELGRLGSYRVLKLLGRGGMGLVFLAEDTQLQRPVALKVMRPSLATGIGARARFLREAQAAAAIRHDHIVTIYQVGEDHGVPFLAMELLEGASLEERLGTSSLLQVEEVLNVGRQVAEGLAAAHERGLIHRDVKPANIWLAETDRGHQREFRVKLLDFGLARVFAEGDQPHDAALTKVGAIVGTPSYMAPEQAEHSAVGPASDLFSLGCVLYRISTGRLPFKGDGTLSTLRAIALTNPTPPSSLNPAIPRSLNDLILRLLSKNPTDRPTSARAVIQEMDALLAAENAGAIVSPARPIASPNGARLRMPLLVAASLLAFVGLTVLAQQIIVRVRDKDGNIKHEYVLDDKDKLEIVSGDGLPNSPASKDPRVPAGQSPLDRLDPKNIPADERFPWQPKELVAVYGSHKFRHWSMASGLAYSKGGKRINSWGTDGHRLWEASTGKELAHFDPKGGFLMTTDFETIAYMNSSDAGIVIDRATGKERFHFRGKAPLTMTPDGKNLIVTVEGGQAVQSWDVETGKLIKTIPVRVIENWTSLLFSPDSKFAVGVSAASPKSVQLFEVDGWKERGRLEGHTGEISNLFLSPDGKTIVTASVQDKSLRIWDLDSRKESSSLPQESLANLFIAFSSDSKSIATAVRLEGWSWRVTVRDTATGAEKFHKDCKCQLIPSVVFAVNGEVLAVSEGAPFVRAPTDGGKIRLYNAGTGDEISVFTTAEDVNWLASSPGDEHRIAAASRDGTLQLFDVTNRKKIGVTAGPQSIVNFVALTSDGRTLAANCLDRTAVVWDVATGKERARLASQSFYMRPGTIAFSPNNQHFCWGAGYKLRFWEVDTGKTAATELNAGGNVMTYSPDGRFIACDDTEFEGGQHQPGMALWTLATGNRRWLGKLGTVRAIAFAPDSQSLVGACDRDNVAQIKIWDVSTGKERFTLEGHKNPIHSLTVSPDGKTIASAAADETFKAFGELKLWSLENGKEIASYPTTKDFGIMSVAFAPDGSLLSADSGGRIIQWYSATKSKEICQLPGPVMGIALAKDGRHLATANYNGTVYILRFPLLSK